MKNKCLYFMLSFVALFFITGCDKNDDNEEIKREDYSVFDLCNESIDYDYYLTDGQIEVLIEEDIQTKKPVVATVHDPSTKENIHIFFDEQGYPNIIEIDKNYIVLGGYESGMINAAVIVDEEVFSFRELKVNWDNNFYDTWNNSPSNQYSRGIGSVDWGRLGELWWDNFKPTLIGVGYGLQAARDICTVLAPDPTVTFVDRRLALLGIAAKLGEAIAEGLPNSAVSKELREFSKELGYAKDAAQVQRDYQRGESVINILLDYLEDFALEDLSEVLIDMGKREEVIELGEYVVTTGSGQIKVTLRWNNHNDIDLHVVDPYKEEIFWNHKYSFSGGFLDFDNVEAYGPENVYWLSTDLDGDFHVYVNHYFGYSSTVYTIFVEAFGRCRTFSGTLGISQTKYVARFNKNGIYLPNETRGSADPGITRSLVK